MKQRSRPVNLDLMTLKFPVTAIISILHRISGVILFLVIPCLLGLLGCSLKSEESFNQVVRLLSSLPSKLIIFAILTALVYHLFAGCRHIIMDFGYGESLKSGRIGAYLVLILTVITMIGLGIWLW